MSGHARAVLAAALVLAAAVLTPAAAGERATLKVTARVVDRCTITVPPMVPPGLWRERQHEPRHFVRHDCRGRPPLRIDARELVAQLRERVEDLRERVVDLRDRGRVSRDRHPNRHDVVLITITY